MTKRKKVGLRGGGGRIGGARGSGGRGVKRRVKRKRGGKVKPEIRYMLGPQSRRPSSRRRSRRRVKAKSKSQTRRTVRFRTKIRGRFRIPPASKGRRRRRRRRAPGRPLSRRRKSRRSVRGITPRSILKSPRAIKSPPVVPDMTTSSTSLDPASDSTILPTNWKTLVRNTPQEIISY